MLYSKKTRSFAQSLVANHAKYDSLSECYCVSLDDLFDFDLQKLASLVYIDNPDFATESTGPDNNLYDRKMMPALLIYLKNPLDRDADIGFRNAWLEGVTHYARHSMEELIEQELDVFNSEHPKAA